MPTSPTIRYPSPVSCWDVGEEEILNALKKERSAIVQAAQYEPQASDLFSEMSQIEKNVWRTAFKDPVYVVHVTFLNRNFPELQNGEMLDHVDLASLGQGESQILYQTALRIVEKVLGSALLTRQAESGTALLYLSRWYVRYAQTFKKAPEDGGLWHKVSQMFDRNENGDEVSCVRKLNLVIDLCAQEKFSEAERQVYANRKERRKIFRKPYYPPSPIG